MIPRSSSGASATSPRAEGEEWEVRNKDRAGTPRAKVSVVISRRASVIREFKRGIVAARPFYHYRPFSHYPTFACFAVLCDFAPRIGSYSFNIQRKVAKDCKARGAH